MARTPVTLFRMGNATDPRMDRVRAKDVEMFDAGRDTWVRAGTGGISTSEFPGPLAGKWWRLDAGHEYGALILVWNDYDRHWSWEPVEDMRLSDFQAALRATHPHFIRV